MGTSAFSLRGRAGGSLSMNFLNATVPAGSAPIAGCGKAPGTRAFWMPQGGRAARRRSCPSLLRSPGRRNRTPADGRPGRAPARCTAEPAEIRTKPPGDARRKHALHLPEQRPRLARRDPEVVQALGVEVGLDAGRVHIQHRVEHRQQTLAGGIGTLIRVEIHTGGVRGAAEGRVRPVGSRQHGARDRSGTTPSTSRSRRIARRGEAFVTAQRTDREPVRAASRGETFHHEHGLALAVVARETVSLPRVSATTSRRRTSIKAESCERSR